jgi:hypothetical protein
MYKEEELLTGHESQRCRASAGSGWPLQDRDKTPPTESLSGEAMRRHVDRLQDFGFPPPKPPKC